MEGPWQEEHVIAREILETVKWFKRDLFTKNDREKFFLEIKLP